MRTPELLVATTNRGKAREFAWFLRGLPLRVLDPQELEQAVPPVEEDGDSFIENAALKAEHWRDHTGRICLADDSGLAVEALDGAPGIWSARFAGPGAGDRRNLELLLERLREVPDERRGAAFHCALALARPGASTITFQGSCRGLILREPRGAGGFGYDPVFWYPPLGKSFAELSPEEKHAVSHRARAFAELHQWLEQHPPA